VFSAASADRLRIHWNGPTELEIAYPRQDSVLRSTPAWNNVKISYKEDPTLRRPYPDAVR